MTLSKKHSALRDSAKQLKRYTQHNGTQYCNAECYNAECRYAECFYAECHYAECRGVNLATTGVKNVSALHRHETNIGCSWTPHPHSGQIFYTKSKN